MNCSQCNNPLSGTEKFCPQCAAPVQLSCRHCGGPLAAGMKFCPNCATLTGTGKEPPAPSAGEAYTPPAGNAAFVSGGGFGTQSPPGGTGPAGTPPLPGAGGFGAVYKAFDSQLKDTIALKVVFTQLGQAQLAVDQLNYEFKARERIENVRHILKAYFLLTDHYQGLELVLLPMEYAPGGSLRQWLVANRVRPGMANEQLAKRNQKALAYFKQACAGVQAVHTAGLVHLDLKPENLLIGAEGRVKVADFGLARNTLQMSMAAAELLRDGVGTAQYMAPEQIMAARPSAVLQTGQWRQFESSGGR